MSQPRARILVVDDDLNLLELLVDTLRSVGYRVEGVSNGNAALDKLAAESYDLLVSDIKMPGMDGITLSRKVRRRYPNLPVLLITGVAAPEIIGRVTADGFLAKPFRINKIEELIESTLQGKPEPVAAQIRHILVVDDDETYREMLADALRYNDYVPLAVSSGEEALRQLEQGLSDAVISDIRMPGMDGIDLSRRIKARYPDLPVILITGYLSEREIASQTSGNEIDGFLEKPFRIEKIIEMLQQISPRRSDSEHPDVR